MSTIGIILIIILAVATIAGIVAAVIYCSNPFDSEYPKRKIVIDISGKRQPSLDDAIDEYILVKGFNSIDCAKQLGERYEMQMRNEYAGNQHRLEQLDETVAANKKYTIILQRKQTKYRQQNYVKYPYTVIDEVARYQVDYEQLLGIYKQLEAINFEATRRDYNAKDQRKLMTKELRRRIMIRDNYTCKRCGKYMYDEVGLHIDHIIPVAKGGKTVESNLQVLCSKCNSSKSDKLI